MGLRTVQGDGALTFTTAGAGTVTSGPIANPGVATDVILMVHVSATSGTPTFNASLEQSDDNSTYTAVTGSAITQLSAAGNAISNARVTKPYVRVTYTIAGGTPSVTGRAAVLVIPE
jgi:hypothetical protein